MKAIPKQQKSDLSVSDFIAADKVSACLLAKINNQPGWSNLSVRSGGQAKDR